MEAMPKKTSSQEPTRPDLLKRIDALPEKATEICRMAGLTIQFISAMRLGKCTKVPPGDWTRMEATLALLEAKHGKDVALKMDPAPSAADKAMDELSDDINHVDTLEKLILVQRKAMSLIARGIIGPAQARVLSEAFAKCMSMFKAKAEDDERAKAGQEMVVVVKYIDTWRKP